MDPGAGATLEVGPATFRRLDGDIGAVPAAMADAALDGIDDPVVLLEERPVDVDALLRAVLRAALHQSPGRVTVVHPSWWPAPRTTRLLAAAAAVNSSACGVTRAAWIRRRGGGEVVIEVAGPMVVVSKPQQSTVHSNPAAERIATAVGAVREVSIDDPQRTATGGKIREALRDRGIGVREVDLATLVAPTEPSRARRRGGVVVTVVVLVALAAGIAATFIPRGRPPAAAAGSVSVVEGRVAVRVPAQWSVRRVTGGPGSARVEVRSPGDPAAVLHITWSYTPDTTVEATAAVLRRAAAALPREVFTAIAPAEVAGRPVLAYREIRPGRLIDWSVLLDGDTRIAIGCQCAAGRQEAVLDACEQAVRSAREIVGTDRGPAASN